MQEREAQTDLTQTHHAHEESYVGKRTVDFSNKWETRFCVERKRVFSGVLEDEILMSALQVQREQILAEAKF